jgi:hypothetical protein
LRAGEAAEDHGRARLLFLLWPELCRRSKIAAEAQRHEAKGAAERTADALRLWDEAVPLAGTPAIRYLEARKIFKLPPNVDNVLRWHPSCPFGRARVGCMVALFRDALTDEPRAVHRTHVNDIGKGAERMALGPIARAAIKLWPAGEQLVVGEGIENVLAASQMIWKGTRLSPGWAATVANNMAGLPVIPGVKRLFVLVDNDASRTGERKAAELNWHWRNAGCEIVFLKHPIVGRDFNDLLSD